MRARALAFVVSGLLFAPVAAQAATITLDSSFQGVFVGYHYDLEGDFSSTLGSVSMTGAGFDPAFAALNGSFEAYCADIIGGIFDIGFPGQGDTVAADAAPMSTWEDPGGADFADHATRALRASYLYNTNASAIASLPVPDPNDPNSDPHGDALIQRTALQMAIWEVLYDTDFDVASTLGSFYMQGVFTDNAAVIAAATTMLAPLKNGTAVLGGDAAWIQLPGNAQDFIGPAQSAAPVPEPGTMLLLGTGLAGLAFRRFRSAR